MELEVSEGESPIVYATNSSPLYVTLPKDNVSISARVIKNENLSAKISEGDVLGKIVFYNKQKMVVSKQAVQMGGEYESANKQNYPHFMLKEIMEEKTAILNQISVYESAKVLERFDSFVNAYFSAIAVNERIIKELTEARDRLLPKLMSGEVEV